MSTMKTLLEAMNVSILHDSDAEIAEGVRIMQMSEEITGVEISTLRALYEYGPLDDGDVPSRVGRDMLTEKGLANRIIQKGEHGYSACTYKGAQLILFLFAREKNNIGA